jgi:hypothetical protein
MKKMRSRNTQSIIASILISGASFSLNFMESIDIRLGLAKPSDWGISIPPSMIATPATSGYRGSIEVLCTT